MTRKKEDKMAAKCVDAQEEKSLIWSTALIEQANNRLGFQQIDAAITGGIYGTGILMILCIPLVSVAQWMHMPIPGFLRDYALNPICAINMMLLLVLTNAHNYYYNATKTTLLLSDFSFLQWLDFFLKIYLFFCGFVQCMRIESFVFICTFAYLLTFIRVYYLRKMLDKNHPLYKRIEEAWYPNNVRHVAVMVVWCIFFYLLLRTNLAYRFVSCLINADIDFTNSDINAALFVVRLTFLIVFDFYWMYRALHKVIIRRNANFHLKNEGLFKKEVDEYYAKTDHL